MKLTRNLTILCLAAVATSSMAQTIKFLGTGLGGGTFTVSYTDSHNNLATDNDVFAGLLHFKTNTGHKFYSVCGDLSHVIHVGDTYGIDRSDTYSYMNSDAALFQAGNIVAADMHKVDDNIDAKALQIAVWDTLYQNDSNYSITPISGALQTEVNEYLADKNTAGHAVFLAAEPGSGGQSQIAAVPEPGSLLAFAIGGIGIFIRRRK